MESEVRENGVINLNEVIRQATLPEKVTSR